MRPYQKIKTHAHHTIPVGESLEALEWHLKHLPDVGWTTIKEMPAKKHTKMHAKKRRNNKNWGKPVYFGRVIVGYERGKG